MAKATYTPAVTETKTVEVEPAKVTLELTEKEAAYLKAVLGRTNGSALASVWDALDNLGLKARARMGGPTINVAAQLSIVSE